MWVNQTGFRVTRGTFLQSTSDATPSPLTGTFVLISEDISANTPISWAVIERDRAPRGGDGTSSVTTADKGAFIETLWFPESRGVKGILCKGEVKNGAAKNDKLMDRPDVPEVDALCQDFDDEGVVGTGGGIRISLAHGGAAISAISPSWTHFALRDPRELNRI